MWFNNPGAEAEIIHASPHVSKPSNSSAATLGPYFGAVLHADPADISAGCRYFGNRRVKAALPHEALPALGSMRDRSVGGPWRSGRQIQLEFRPGAQPFSLSCSVSAQSLCSSMQASPLDDYSPAPPIQFIPVRLSWLFRARVCKSNLPRRNLA